VLAVPAAAVVLAPAAQAATPGTWPAPDDMSLLTALLVFAGIPLGVIAVITLLVMAPSLVRGDRQQRGVASWTEPQWFGGPREAVPAGRHAVREVGAGVQSGQESTAGEKADQAGGASARW
jgi:hypothetical protein